jgi:hypothetical protein
MGNEKHSIIFIKLLGFFLAGVGSAGYFDLAGF